jgi:hypothetical protein
MNSSVESLVHYRIALNSAKKGTGEYISSWLETALTAIETAGFKKGNCSVYAHFSIYRLRPNASG